MRLRELLALAKPNRHRPVEPGIAVSRRDQAVQDRWGVEGWREHRTVIVGWLLVGQERRGWREKLAAAARAEWTFGFRLSVVAPLTCLVDDAIRRAEGRR